MPHPLAQIHNSGKLIKPLRRSAVMDRFRGVEKGGARDGAHSRAFAQGAACVAAGGSCVRDGAHAGGSRARD